MLHITKFLTFLLLAALLISACQPMLLTEDAPAVSASAEVTEYAHPEALASTEWLAEHLTDPGVRILEGRQPPARRYYEHGHIPGAVFVDVFGDLSDPDAAVPLMILPPDAFEALMGKLGISNDTTVVVYDDEGGVWASRLWWALRYYGHDTVKILDGGLHQWVAEDRPLETTPVTPEPAEFVAQVVPDLIATADQVQQAINAPDVRIVDALPASYYLGAVKMSPNHRSGHIPSARSLPASENLDVSADTILPPAQLARNLTRLDLQPNQRVVTYCGAGYAGAFDLFVLYLMGYEDVSLYDGSWLEWGANPDLPVETPIS